MESAHGCVRRANALPAFCLLRVLVGRARSLRICRQLCQLYLHGDETDHAVVLLRPLEKLARERWRRVDVDVTGPMQ